MSAEFPRVTPPAAPTRIPTTDAQQELWTAAQLGERASLAFNEAVAITLHGVLDHEALRTAIAQLVSRHEALRARCGTDGRSFELFAEGHDSLDIADWSLRDAVSRRQALQEDELALVNTPFDLASGPLVRFALRTLAPDMHQLTIAAHHIVCDGWSFGVIARELGALYSAACSGTAAQLAPADSLATYSAMLQKERLSAEYEAAESYWISRFRDEVPPLELPTDFTRPAVRSFEAGRVDLSLDAALVRALRQHAQSHGSTLFGTMLTGFAVLLHRLGQLDDLVIGIPTAGQANAGLSHLVGHCVNLLPLRIQPSAEQPFTALNNSVRGTLLDALDHQQLTFGALLKLLPIARDPSRLPLVNVVFNVDRGLSNDELGFAGLTAEFRAVPRTHENFELFLNAVEQGDSIVLELQYSRTLFDEATVTRWLSSYGELLRGVTEQPESAIGRLPILTDADRTMLASFERGPVVPVDESRLIHQRVAETAAAMPSATAVRSDTTSRSYAELDAMANRIAQLLRARGVVRDTPVGVLLPRDVRLPETVIGVLRAGGAYVPLDPDLPVARLHFLVQDAALAHVITASSVRSLLPSDQSINVLDLDADSDLVMSANAAPLVASADDATPESTSFVIYTSGSTGIPKGCRNTHRGLLNFSCSNGGESGPVAGTVVMALAASGFDASVGEITMALSLGAQLVIVPREIATDGRRLAQAMDSFGATMFFGSPASFKLLLDAGWKGHPGMTVVSGGEALSRELAAVLSERAGQVWNVYGPTEAAVWVTRALVSPPPPRMTIGSPMANSRFEVLDAFGVRVPVGVAGELFIAGPNVGSGYINRDELTAQRFLPDPLSEHASARRYYTGDVVRWLPNGTLEFIGRNDDQVKLRGFRIELGEIAARLEQLPEVSAAIAMVRTGPDDDHRLVAYIQQTVGAAPDEVLMRRHLAALLPAYMVPQAFVVMDAFPVLATGKVNRRALPAPTDHTVDEGRAYRAPSTPLEEILAKAWARGLRVARVSIDDDFFELGGHSLLASQILATLRSAHALDVPYRLFFEAPTVARLATAITEMEPGSSTDAIQPISKRSASTPAPASITQQRLYLLEALDPGNRLVLAHGAAWRLTGTLDVGALEQAMNDVIARHDTLRTRFDVAQGALRQIVEPSVSFALARLDVEALPDAQRELVMIAEIERLRAAPFDRTVAPLFRSRLTRISEQEHVLFTLQHGLIWDGWSFDVFLDDLTTAYAARRLGGMPAWAPLPITYSDYAEWQGRHLTSPAMERQVSWWREHLGGALPVLELPTDHPRPPHPSFEGGRVQLQLEAEEVEQLRRAAQQAGVTLFQLLFTAFHVLLHRYTGQPELVIAMPLRNRSRAEVANLIGPFTNTVAIRSRINGSLTFKDVLRAVRADCVQALEHEEMPFELLERAAPVVRALFSMQDARGRPRELDGCRIDQVTLTEHTATNDLMLWTMEYPSSLLMVLSYRSDLFTQISARTLLEQFRSVVREGALHPERNVEQLALHSEAAHDAWQQSRSRSRSEANRGTLMARSARLQRALSALDVAEGSRVLLRTHDDATRSALQLAAFACGAILVCAQPDDADALLQSLVDADNIALLVTDRALTVRGVRSTTLQNLRAAAANEPMQNEATPVLIGATARIEPSTEGPRVVVQSVHDSQQAVASWHEALGLADGDTVLDLASGSHDGAPWIALAALSASAAHVASEDPLALEGDEIDALLSSSGASVLVAHQSSIRELRRVQWQGDPKLRVLLFDAADVETNMWLRERVRAVQRVVSVSGVPGIVALQDDVFAHEVRVLEAVGASVHDALGGDAAASVRGRLSLGGVRYPARRRADGVVVLSTPALPSLAGSTRDLPLIARLLAVAANVSEAVVALKTDATGNDRLVGYLSAPSSVPEAAIRQLLKTQLPIWALPSVIMSVDLRSDSGEAPVAGALLPNPWERVDETPRRSVPETEAERLLAGWWSELIGAPTVRLSDNFFSLGGHSLLCFRLIERVQSSTGVRLDPRSLLFGTLERVAAELADGLPAQSSAERSAPGE